MRYDQLVKATKLDPTTQLLRLRSDPEQLQAYIEQTGAALQERFEGCEREYLRLLDTVPTEVVDGQLRTEPIVIGRAVENIEGFSYAGIWKARVAEKNHLTRGERRPELVTTAWFEADDKNFLTGARVGARLPAVTEAFGNEFAFSQVGQVGWNEHTLLYALDAYAKPVERAEETLELLWDAIQDDELNPGLLRTGSVRQA